jgi:cell division protein FtsB
LSKVADTYWTNSQTITMPAARTRKKAAGRANTTTPHWFLFVVVASVFFMICLAVNIRAVSEMSAEAQQNSQLSTDVEKLSVENLALQEEIHNLKNDDHTIEREARKIGMSRPNEKFLVPTN